MAGKLYDDCKTLMNLKKYATMSKCIEEFSLQIPDLSSD